MLLPPHTRSSIRRFFLSGECQHLSLSRHSLTFLLARHSQVTWAKMLTAVFDTLSALRRSRSRQLLHLSHSQLSSTQASRLVSHNLIAWFSPPFQRTIHNPPSRGTAQQTLQGVSRQWMPKIFYLQIYFIYFTTYCGITLDAPPAG